MCYSVCSKLCSGSLIHSSQSPYSGIMVWSPSMIWSPITSLILSPLLSSSTDSTLATLTSSLFLQYQVPSSIRDEFSFFTLPGMPFSEYLFGQIVISSFSVSFTIKFFFFKETVSITKYADGTTLMAESEEELNKDEGERGE